LVIKVEKGACIQRDHRRRGKVLLATQLTSPKTDSPARRSGSAAMPGAPPFAPVRPQDRAHLARPFPSARKLNKAMGEPFSRPIQGTRGYNRPKSNALRCLHYGHGRS
jgi:hypothetical protein